MAPIEIVVHPARRQPRKSWLLLFYLGLTSLLLGRFLLLGAVSPWWVGGAAAVVALAFVFTLRRWFCATVFRFEDEALSVEFMGRTARYPWSRFHSFAMERRGVFLSPSRDPRAFDRWRGVYVYLRDFVVSVNGGPPSDKLAAQLETFLRAHVF